MKFSLDNSALERVFHLWNIPMPVSGLVLFAFRGATSSSPRSSSAGWMKSITLETLSPDYIHMRCTLGIWDRATGKIFAAPGSTVPHRDQVLKAAARKGLMQGRGTNQLEPGYYTDLTKGEHLQGKPQGHAALRQTGFRFYRRARHAPPYTNRDTLFFGNPYDNLHCAWNPAPEVAGFRSAGCLVVAGWPHSPRLMASDPRENQNKGHWKTFHDILYAANQKSFPLLLLPAQDVAEALEGSKFRPRLTFGSEGPAVAALQKKLAERGFYKGKSTGKLGVATYRAWNQSEAFAKRR